MTSTDPRGTPHLDDEHLSTFLDDELAPDEAAAARSHLAACDRCRARLAAFEQVSRLVSVAPAPADELTAARLVREARALPTAGRAGRPRPALLAAGAVAASVLAVAVIGGLVSGRDAGQDVASTDLQQKTMAAPESDAAAEAAGSAPTAGASAAPAAEPLDDPAVLEARVRALSPTTDPEPACGPEARAATGATGPVVGSFVGTKAGEPVLVLVLDAGGGRRRALVTGAGCVVRDDVVISGSGEPAGR